MSPFKKYPTDENDKAIDTCDWRDADNIKDCAHAKDSKITTACRQYDTNPELIEACLKGAEDINTPDRFGFTPLMLAVKSKQDHLAHLIMDEDNVDIDVQTKRGFNALMLAAWKGNTEIVAALIKKGAKLDMKDSGGRNAWGIAHDWHNEETLILLDQNGLNFKSMGGTETSFPPAPKWRQDEKW